MDPTNGVSEVIGVVLLISLVVAAIAIIGIFLFSQQTPQQIPNLNFMTGSDGTGNLLLFHNGGDSLTKGTFFVTVDQVPKSYTLSDGGNVWSLGKTLNVTAVSAGSHTVQIIYNVTGSSGGVLLRTSSVNVSTSPLGSISPDVVPTISPTPTGVDCSAVNNPTCAAQISPDTILTQFITNTTKKSIRFMQASQARGTISGAAGTTYHFNFTVSDNNSTLTTGANSAGGDACTAIGTTYKLVKGDNVGIVLTADPDTFYIYGIDSQIWYMAVGGRTRLTIQIYNQTRTTATLVGTNSICNAYINSYTNLDSTIQILSQTTNVIKYLKVNNTEYINGLNTSAITLNNVKPIPNGLFLITYDAANAPLYFIGWTDSMTGRTPPLGL